MEISMTSQIEMRFHLLLSNTCMLSAISLNIFQVVDHYLVLTTG